MPFDQQKKTRIAALMREIEGRKKFEEDGATYRDSPALQEIAALTEQQLCGRLPLDQATLIEGIGILRYLADRYDSMGRCAVSARFYNRLLSLAAELQTRFGTATGGIDALFRQAARARNYYVDDPCEDLAALAVVLLPAEDAVELTVARRGRRHLKHDPVEMTDAYLAVIDEVEERVEKTRTSHGFGSCHEVWSLRRQYLAEYGITWRSPAMMNPMVMFD